MKVTYVGADVHQKSTTFHMLDANGKTIQETTVRTTPENVLDVVSGRRGKTIVAVEESTHARWFYELLTPAVDEVIVCDPQRVRPNDVEEKSDEIDAYWLAKGAYTGQLKPIFHGPSAHSVLRELVKSYDLSIKQQTAAKNRIRSIYRNQGRWTKGTSMYTEQGRKVWLDQLSHAGVRQRLLVAYEELDQAEVRCEKAKESMVQCAKKMDGWRYVISIPAFGEIRTSQTLGWLGTPHRFRTDRQLRKYCGLAVVYRTSSDYDDDLKRRKKVRVVGLNTRFCRPLKAVFKNAANGCIMLREKYPEIAAYYDRRAAEKGDQLARVDLARKLVKLVWILWKRQEVYDPEKVVWTA